MKALLKMIPDARLLALVLLFFAANTAYLHRVPGLLGDEGSEGENVYQLLTADSITVVGERSYIGPMIDYLRVPFIALFGYTALALRVPVLIASMAAFLLAASLLRRLFGRDVGDMALVASFFSPIFLLQHRLGWAISLNVWLAFLLLYALCNSWKHKWLLAGLIAGAGLSNDIIFLPTMVAIGICAAVGYLCSKQFAQRAKTLLASSWLIAIGFMAGFGTQLAVLLLLPEDQGSRAEVVAQLPDRVRDFLPAMPLYISGSSYVARYTGVEFSPGAINAITAAVIVLALAGLFHARRAYVALVAAGVVIHSYLLLYMVDRFTLRYFTVLTVVLWLLAGAGLGTVLYRIVPRRVFSFMPGTLALLLLIWTWYVALLPFLRTGGSLQEFSLGNRNDKASALVDTRGLLDCVRGIGIVYGATQDIYDRLLFASREYADIVVVEGDHKAQASWRVSYTNSKEQGARVCPASPHFQISPVR